MKLFAIRPRQALLALSLCLVAGAPSLAGPSSSAQGTKEVPEPPTALYEVVKIVDGDTIHIQRGKTLEKLRLLSVDTEEKFSPGRRNSSSKPQTIFGEETRLWTIDFLEQFRSKDGKLCLGLRFPGGLEARDVYGRLLCHVLLPDGSDFNLLLVELGKSPYFNKYGNSRICHEAFVEAQAAARRNRIGVWNPRTNLPGSDGQPSAKRAYERLLPWWQARAEAIDDFRARALRDPTHVIAAEDPEGLAAALRRGEPVRIFGSVDRFFDEADGSRTVLMRTNDKRRALRISIPEGGLAAFEPFDLASLRAEFRQNYVYVLGILSEGARGFQLRTPTPQSWERAGTEPELP